MKSENKPNDKSCGCTLSSVYERLQSFTSGSSCGSRRTVEAVPPSFTRLNTLHSFRDAMAFRSLAALFVAATAVTGTAAAAVERASSAATAKFCGAPNDFQVISGTPWIVYSMNYNYQDISGSCCTEYFDFTGSGDNQTIHWSSVWDIDEAVSTNVVKGYSFIGLTQNLETQLSAISSIPSTYEWTISNTTAYKGWSRHYLIYTVSTLY